MEKIKDMTVKEIYDFIDSIAPFCLAEDFDNVGLLIGDFSQNVSKVAVALDGTDEVLKKAVCQGAELLITHHPVIFNPIKQLFKDSLPYKFAQSEISVISAHTNLDKAPGGVGDALANALNLLNVEELPQTEGMGRIGVLSKPMKDFKFAKFTEDILNISVRYTPVDREIKKVAVLGGAGDFALETAANFGADAFVTGESKHHILLEARRRNICYVDAGHYATEAVVCPILAKKISDAFKSIDVVLIEQEAPAIGRR